MKNSEFHKVLAYGSNLDTEDWDKFVARYAQTNVIFRSLGKVIIPDYGLVFDKYAHSRKGGVANIRYNKGSIAEAVLFDANDEAIRLLRQKEGHPNHYEEKGIEVHPMNHGGNWEFEFGKVKYVNAIHTSSFPAFRCAARHCRWTYRRHLNQHRLQRQIRLASFSQH